MSRVIIHAGTPKTGTTALQDFLPANEHILNRLGYSFPEVPFSFRGVAPHQTAHFLAVWEPGGPVSEEWDQGFALIQEALRSYDNVIFSDEQVWWRQHKEGFWEEVMRRMKAMGATLDVVVYLRRQDEQLESFYNEKVKGMPKLTLTFSEYLNEGYNDYFPLDYAAELDRFASYLGKEHVIVRTYEKERFVGGNIFADFLDAIGLKLTEEYELPKRHANTRWPEHVMEVKRMANAAISYHRRRVPNFYRTAIEEAYGIGTADTLPTQKYGFFSAEERRRFMSCYEDGNAYVAREYLGREDGVLFYDAVGELPQYQPDRRTLLEDAVRMLSGADTLLYERQAELLAEAKKLNEELGGLYESLPFRIYRRLRDRKRKSDISQR